ncbi:hypothetical protein HPL003_19400 [Paenibacillus terrae HPL-003]|uniref:Uncharacterized protein n=1 Tax=Paenibacillus terrae (strain HPL-003) TaxID=985665 RepID=G7W2W4_PAETH|nr:hypothetical protein HPL003_19400 [Paenibacillus terrae HPL-003]
MDEYGNLAQHFIGDTLAELSQGNRIFKINVQALINLLYAASEQPYKLPALLIGTNTLL